MNHLHRLIGLIYHFFLMTRRSIKRAEKSNYLLFGLGIATSFLITQSHANSLGEDKIFVFSEPSSRVAFSRMKVYSDERGLIIKGKLRPINKISVSNGHIDVMVVDSNEKVIYATSVYSTPRIIHSRKRRNRNAKFTAMLPQQPPMGSKVVVSFHRNKIKTSQNPLCPITYSHADNFPALSGLK